MTHSWLVESFRHQLEAMSATHPKNVLTRIAPDAEDHGVLVEAADLTQIIQAASTNDPLLAVLGRLVHVWDAAPSSEDWTAGTVPSTDERRQLVCDRLGLNSQGTEVLLQKRPIYHDKNIVISGTWDPWYDTVRASQRTFYWDHYRDYLVNVRHWPQESLTSLDFATGDVIKRLADPASDEAYQSKGLVVGYVQSGKTANFTGVIAKAIDVGYRLIIVLTGTIEMLRSQTQRRIDMEMVGRKNILGDLSAAEAIEQKIDYQADEAWLGGRFLDVGSAELETEILRLTTHKKDYQKQFKTLKMDRYDMSLPFYNPENLYRSSARLVIVKKNGVVLKKLNGDLQANRNAFKEIPCLIIDDESDQASVNTVDPEKVARAKREGKEIKARRAINQHIATMLESMPRAQYVAYTATPFANVFVDPADEQGIFPRDFVIGLQRPPGYMGVDDFHDFLEPEEGARKYDSNRAAFVRDLLASDEEEDQAKQDEELGGALDMFVLTGAVKLHREKAGSELRFRHHTMLVHDSVSTLQHREAARRVVELWGAAEYSQVAGKNRLRSLYEKDMVPVSEARLEAGVPQLPVFDELVPFIANAVSRISESGGNPVLVVNSDKELKDQQQVLDFDKNSVWRVLVGGAKLSRGFTVEGLTITYFRRATNMSDTLTQMGRWFGFRHGYRDLVRLFIARNANFGKKRVDLYEAFENIAYDESGFRDQLRDYAKWDGDRPKVLPREIPPLVTQHLPWLKPTARDKMFNAVVEVQSKQPFTPSGYANHVDALMRSLNVWRPVMQEVTTDVVLPLNTKTSYSAFAGIIGASTIIDAMKRTEYLKFYSQRSVGPVTNFYENLIAFDMLKDFLVVFPQPQTATVNINDVGARAIIDRDRREGRGGLFGEMADPKHKQPLLKFLNPDLQTPEELIEFVSPTRGALLLYLAKEVDPEYDKSPAPSTASGDSEYGLVAAYSAYVPLAALPEGNAVIRFRVHDTSAESDVVVESGS